jgi:hypothetical protein
MRGLKDVKNNTRSFPLHMIMSIASFEYLASMRRRKVAAHRIDLRASVFEEICSRKPRRDNIAKMHPFFKERRRQDTPSTSALFF